MALTLKKIYKFTVNSRHLQKCKYLSIIMYSLGPFASSSFLFFTVGSSTESSSLRMMISSGIFHTWMKKSNYKNHLEKYQNLSKYLPFLARAKAGFENKNMTLQLLAQFLCKWVMKYFQTCRLS